MNEKHISIDKVENGYVVYLQRLQEKEDDWGKRDTFICLSLEEAIKRVEDYFV